jgi:hypothetical protein
MPIFQKTRVKYLAALRVVVAQLWATNWQVLTWSVFLRLTGSFDYYIRYTDGMVGPAPELPSTLGTSAPKTNNCNLRTNGWELSIGWRDRLNSGLGYSATFTLSDAKTIVTSYPSNATNTIGLNKRLGIIYRLERPFK